MEACANSCCYATGISGAQHYQSQQILPYWTLFVFMLDHAHHVPLLQGSAMATACGLDSFVEVNYPDPSSLQIPSLPPSAKSTILFNMYICIDRLWHNINCQSQRGHGSWHFRSHTQLKQV